MAAATGFYCKELSALLPPLFFLTLLCLPQRRLLRSPIPWFAALLFVALLAPDICHNLTQRFSAGGATCFYGNYLDHFSRIGGLGLNIHPTLFYVGSFARAWQIPFFDALEELPMTNFIVGAMLLGCAALLLCAAPRIRRRSCCWSPSGGSLGPSPSLCRAK